MTIIEELEKKGIQKLELDIIERCWQNNISATVIANIMGKGFSIPDIERVIAYFNYQKEMEDCETMSDEGFRRLIRVIKLYNHDVPPSRFADLFDLPIEHMEGLYQEVEEEFK